MEKGIQPPARISLLGLGFGWAHHIAVGWARFFGWIEKLAWAREKPLENASRQGKAFQFSNPTCPQSGEKRQAEAQAVKADA